MVLKTGVEMFFFVGAPVLVRLISRMKFNAHCNNFGIQLNRARKKIKLNFQERAGSFTIH